VLREALLYPVLVLLLGMMWGVGGLTFGPHHAQSRHGETQMGKYKFSSWTLHMASIIIFSSLWGIALHEWRGSSGRTRRWLALSLAMLGALHHGCGLRQLSGGAGSLIS